VDKEQQLREKLSQERMRAARTTHEITTFQARSAQLEVAIAEAMRLQMDLQYYLMPFGELYLKANPIVDIMQRLNESFAALVPKAKDVEKFAVHEAVPKTSFVAGVVDVLLAGLVDRRLEDEVRLVLGEVKKGYHGGGLSEEMKGKVRLAEQVLEALPKF
jgi:hypothetical protein